ncbi:sensor histidine kinase [Flavobacterium sp.]|uniref:sensor histidine kinase n=1 Tax=Flavobacterium sp. TaxID=239 RepID=UPI00374CE4DF
MTKKLLQKTINYYFIYAVVILIAIGPIFYFVSNILYIDDANEDLYAIKKQFDKFTKDDLKIKDISIWNTFNRDVNLQKFNGQLKDSLFEHSYYDALNKENEPFRVLNSPVKIENKWYTFSAKINMVEKENLIGSTVILFISLLLLLLIGFFIITKMISKKLWQPFYVALDKMEQFEIDKTTPIKLIHSTTEEFNRLNNAIDNLIDKNSSIYQSQKEFIENAAHELQTPIAIFKGKIETLLQRQDVTEGQFEILDSLNDTTTRLNRLNKNLLLLSKIESNQFKVPENIDINKVINNQLDFFKEQALAKKITVNVKLEQNILVKSNLFLSEILISNLLLNTINHNKVNGSIEIILTKEKLSVSNTGILLQSLETGKLFERFSKVNPSSKGNGLGLSIIKKIAENNNWGVFYKYKNKLHIFEIHF